MFDRRLTHVVAVAEHGSFTAAAGNVGVTQSAVTKSISDLERELGYTIFHRTARGVMLTEEGRFFVERAARLLAEAKDLLRGVTADHDPYAGVLRIGVCPASIEWLLAQPLSLLLSRYPSIRLEVTGGTFERVVQQLRAGVIDVAFGFDAAFSEQPDFRRDPLPPLRTTLFVRLEHPIANLPTVTNADLALYEFILPSESRPYGAFFRNIYESQGIAAQTRMHFIDSFPIVQRLVTSTNSIGTAAVSYTDTLSFKRYFARVPFLEAFPSSPLCSAVRTRWETRPAVRAFIMACRERMSVPAQAISGSRANARRAEPEPPRRTTRRLAATG